MSIPTSTELDAQVSIALVQGAPVVEIPDDLYIPPDALEVILETFEGPLDLLLYLIKRQNLDILDIPIASVSQQYIRYIEMMDGLRIELAAEYLVMAAMLAEIKSRLLLPRPVQSDEQIEDPRAELMRRLLQYERFKDAAEQLDDLPRNGRDCFDGNVGLDEISVVKPQPTVELKEVLIAFQDVLRRAKKTAHHHIQREALSVRERMSMILESLGKVEVLGFIELFGRDEGRQGAVVSFLAVLELCKEGLIEIYQAEPFAELRVKPV